MEENKHPIDEKNIEKELAKNITKIEDKVNEREISQDKADKDINKEVKEEVKEIKKEERLQKKIEEKLEQNSKKEIKQEGLKKTEAVVNGRNLPVSTKYSVAICNYIRGKDIDSAILMLEEVEKMKKAIPMKGEIPHRKGKIMSGRYPIKAVHEFIKLLKSLKANAMINELEFEKYIIFCKANVAARPYRRFGRTRFKRTHITLRLIEPVKKVRRKKK